MRSVEVDEAGAHRTMTWNELRQEVASVAAALKNDNVGPGHRVAAWMPNVRETVVFFLAAMEVGATFTSTSADFGAHGVLERFGQTMPTVLLASSHYSYAGKRIDLADTLVQIRAGLPGLVRTVVVGQCPDDATSWVDYRGVATDEPRPRFDFDHPGTILYTSGTTGKPKCIVHRAAGVLLTHLKEQQLHCDVRPGDRVFYFTTCGWMMWNWLVSMLASGATIVLYDGSPTHPHIDRLWDLCGSERLTLFGTSAKYIDAMKEEPRRTAVDARLVGVTNGVFHRITPRTRRLRLGLPTTRRRSSRLNLWRHGLVWLFRRWRPDKARRSGRNPGDDARHGRPCRRR